MLAMTADITPLLKRVRQYLKRTGKSPTAFGRDVTGSPNLIARLESGNVTLATIRKVEEHLAAGRKKAA